MHYSDFLQEILNDYSHLKEGTNASKKFIETQLTLKLLNYPVEAVQILSLLSSYIDPDIYHEVLNRFKRKLPDKKTTQRILRAGPNHPKYPEALASLLYEFIYEGLTGLSLFKAFLGLLRRDNFYLSSYTSALIKCLKTPHTAFKWHSRLLFTVSPYYLSIAVLILLTILALMTMLRC